MRLAGGKLAGWGATAVLRPGDSCGIIAGVTAGVGSSEAPLAAAAAEGSTVKPGRLFFCKTQCPTQTF
jgi:hypothetical protein